MITTIIPTYRRPQLLARAIRSVLAQTYPDFRVIVYDNASGDETATVVAELAANDARIRYHAHDRNLGPRENFNFGMQRVDTEYFSMLSDDDVLLPYFYEQALQGFASHPTAVMVACPVILVDERGRVRIVTGRDWTPGLYEPPRAILRMAEREHLIWTGALFRRDVLDVGVLDLEVGLSADVDLLLRIAGRHSIAIAARAGAIFTIHTASPSSYPRLDQYWPSWGRIIVKAGADRNVPPEIRAAVQRGLERRLATALLRIGVLSSSRGHDADALSAAAVLQSRHRDMGWAALLRLVAWSCRRLPGARWVLHSVVSRLRWRRRGRFEREQAEVDRHRELLQLTGSVRGQDAAA